MNETTKTDSSLVLWGEIQAKYNPFDATNLWRPISEYQNINERNINKNILHSDNRDLATEDEEDVNYDPIGSHIIALRKYLYLNQQQLQAKQKASEKSEKYEKGKYKKDYFAPPEFPEKYPFSQSFADTSLNTSRKMVKYNGEISQRLLKEKRTIFIKRVLEQVGFFSVEDENMILSYLSAILDDFLQKFVCLLIRNRDCEPFNKDKDLWSALESTLRKVGMGGISGLHSFYYENVVKKHDILEEKCKDMYNQLQKSQITSATTEKVNTKRQKQ